MELGDCMVVLTILAAQLGVTTEQALEMAYNKIRHRTGKTINGQFVKD
jgi:NTP pyrophosphatase (non-canonical NTP hydrolase)